ncbi:MAG: trigger factor [Candidatus Portnoybacteria bacterium]|nr:trigger factor [Candidatus Portnoybacteria bacterium]
MKTETKNLPQSKIEITFELEPAEWQEFINEAVKELSVDLKVAGFRPGHLPKDLVEREVGMAKILARAADLAARKSYVRTVIDDKIEAVGAPKITILKVAEGNPFVFKAEVDVLPTVELPDYKKIAQSSKPKKKEEITVDEKEVGQSLNWLAKSRAKHITVQRGAEKNDRVEIDFEVKVDGEKIDGGESKNHPLILEEGKFIKGFEDNLIGMKEGEKKEFGLIFPADYREKNLANKPADFKVKMKLVQKQELPEINDQFAQRLGDFHCLSDLRQSVKEGLVHEKAEKEKHGWRERVLNEIADKARMELPNALIKQEKEAIIAELKANIEQFGLKWEKYLEELSPSGGSASGGKKTGEELEKGLIGQAEKRVRAFLTLREIAKKEDIDVSEQEAEKEMNNFLRRYPDAELASEIDIAQLKEYTYEVIRNEKVFKLLENL